MPLSSIENIRRQLESKRDELRARLGRIEENVRRGLESDSEERAVQLENKEVVDALGSEAQIELAKIAAALERIESGQYDICADCGERISGERLLAYPLAQACIDCAELAENSSSRV